MKLTLLLISFLLLSSCTIDWNGEKDAKIAELEKQVQELKEKNDDDLFKKNVECQKYLTKMVEVDDFKNMNLRGGISTNRIFYSQSKKTCIYQSVGTEISGTEVSLKCFLTKDALTNQEYDKFCIGLNDKIMMDDIQEAESRHNSIYGN